MAVTVPASRRHVTSPTAPTRNRDGPVVERNPCHSGVSRRQRRGRERQRAPRDIGWASSCGNCVMHLTSSAIENAPRKHRVPTSRFTDARQATFAGHLTHARVRVRRGVRPQHSLIPRSGSRPGLGSTQTRWGPWRRYVGQDPRELERRICAYARRPPQAEWMI